VSADALLRNVVTFGRVLREAGLEVGPGRVADAFRGLGSVDVGRRDDVYWTLRQTLASCREDLEPFDRAFASWFDGVGVEAPPRPRAPEAAPPGSSRRARQTAGSEGADGETDSRGWSREEVLRRKDLGQVADEELDEVRRLVERIAIDRPQRRTRRLRRHHSGRSLDMRGLVRASLATGGDPLQRVYRRRTTVPRKLVVLCDVSGSMEPYARALLLFVHVLVRAGRGVEAFAFGTRLTRLTPDLRGREAEEALRLASERVVDWAGGTRIGASLKRFNDEWGRRALSRGAIVVVLSDGWEREDADLVGREMARLARAAYAVVWVNPLKGDPGYQPLAGGMRAALPHVDRFLPGQNLLDLEALAQVLRGIDRRHAA
jgi:hypothetical protein